jgi:hypothetical protein
MKFALALVAALSIVGAASPSSAQVISASQVLSGCPDLPQAQACPALATSFVSNWATSTEKDRQIVNLVVAIAEAAQQNKVSRQACLNAADGIRVLATGVSIAEQSQQISDVADALCAGNRAASVGRPGASGGNGGNGGNSGNSGFSFSVPESLSEQSSGGTTITVASNSNTDNVAEEGEEGEGTTTGALGNQGNGGSNPVALEHASSVALNDPGVGSDGVPGGTGGGKPAGTPGGGKPAGTPGGGKPAGKP